MNKYSRPNFFHPTFHPYRKAVNTNRLMNQTSKIYRTRNLSEIILKYDSSGVEVEELQNQLISLNYLKGIADGYFGKSTEKAVLNFQKETNQVMDGIVGPTTWELLEQAKEGSVIVNEPTIKKGDNSLFVTSLQLKLNDLGYYQGENDGQFGSKTEEAVKKFQTTYNLPSDGIVRPKTWRAINHEYSMLDNPTPIIITPMLEGASGEEVKTLQQNIKELGYYNGEITGNYDLNTGNSVQKFQEDNEMLPTGIVNQKTWELINEKLEINTQTRNKNVEIPEVLFRQKNVLSRPTLRLGDTGEDVRDLQFYLKELMYFDGTIDNQFGNLTNNAVRAFQSNNKLLVDGIVGRNTWSALINLYSPLSICEIGSNDRYVGIIIDPGHGGEDPGAVSSTVLEKDLNLKISNYMANRFADLDIPFAMTRNTDETLTNAERIKRLKKPFGDVSNAIVISNHINAGGGEGAEVIYPLRNNSTLARNILTEIGNSGQKMRTYYQKALPNDPTKDFYYLMRDTDKLQTLIVEYGFIDNPNDLKRLENNWEKYAEAVVKAVAEYMGYPYNLTEESKTTYIVRPGDSLYSIANRFGTTVEELKRLNKLTNNNLSIGQKLIITEEQMEITPPITGETYLVKEGDTLFSIANRFGTTVEELKRLNKLTNNNLSIGQKLIITEEQMEITPPIIGETYIVKAGDTLYSISKKHNTTVEEIKRLNNLISNNLSVGQELIITGKVIKPPSSSNKYIVKIGDTLWSIARENNTTVNELKTLNNLTKDTLSIGQVLIIPNNTSNDDSQPTIYTVKAGDTLWSIANIYEISIEEIKQLNNLISNDLSIGQQLKIANNFIEPKNRTTIKIGDTLWSIANHYNITVNELKKSNNLLNNRLSIGQEIIIPVTKN